MAGNGPLGGVCGAVSQMSGPWPLTSREGGNTMHNDFSQTMFVLVPIWAGLVALAYLIAWMMRD